MRTTQRVPFLLLAMVTVATWQRPAAAQTSSGAGGDFGGTIRLGYRAVDVDGAERKYREDVNQDDGPVLFRLQFDMVPEGGARQLADRIELDVVDLGSQPFETFRFGMRKFGSYNFQFDRRESEYFYEDILLPPDLVSVRSSTGGDFHHFNFERVRDSAELDLHLSSAATLTFGFDRTTRRGESTTTVDISRDEFEVDKPIDEKLQTSTLAFSYAWDEVTLILEERLREYDNVVELFLPGFSEGESPGPATLDFYVFDQPYAYETHEHAVKLLARPTAKLDLRFAAEIHDLSLHLDAEERYQGIAFNGAPLAVDDAGSGRIGRDLELFDLDVTYLVSDRLAVVGSVRRYGLDQHGDSTLGGDFNTSTWEIDTSGFEGGAVLYLTQALSIGAGLTFESRDVAFAQLENGSGVVVDEGTDSDGFYLDAAWKPGAGMELSAKVDTSSIDNPVTLATPTDRARYRLRARYRWDNGCSLSAVYQFQDFENDASGWAAETTKAALRLGYRNERLSVSVGYTLIDLDRQIDSLVNDILLFDDLYRADVDFVDARVRWQASDRVVVGCSARLYDNAGSFAVEREDLRTYLDLDLGERYVLGLAYRTLDYDEDRFDFDDYQADVAELSIGYRF